MAYNSVVSALEGVNFPISKQDLKNQVGNRDVEVVINQTMSMNELLDACEMDNFNSAGDVVKCSGLVHKIESIPGKAA